MIDISNPSFEKLIENNNIYVDKTEYLYNLLTDGGTYYFCSRPRRFGKTLTVNTLEQILRNEDEKKENEENNQDEKKENDDKIN